MSLPSTVIVPEVGFSKPAIIRSVVVLPQPDGPRNETNSPRSAASEKSCTAAVSPKALRTWVSSRNVIGAPSASSSASDLHATGAGATEDGDHDHGEPGKPEA